MLLNLLLAAFMANGPSQGCVLTELDSGKTVVLSPGEECTVVLPVTGGTGYSWIVAGNQRKTLEVKEGDRAQEAASVGGKEQQQFTVKAKKRGLTRLKFKYVRPWEKDTAVQKSNFFVFEIR